MDFIETSAKPTTNVEMSFMKLCAQIKSRMRVKLQTIEEKMAEERRQRDSKHSGIRLMGDKIANSGWGLGCC